MTYGGRTGRYQCTPNTFGHSRYTRTRYELHGISFYMCNPLRILAIEIDSLTGEGISLSIVKPGHSNKAICSQTNATEVVENHKLARINGFSLLHNLRQYINCDEIEDVEVNH